MIHGLVEGHLSVADKYCDCASTELRDLLISQLEELRRCITIKE